MSRILKRPMFKKGGSTGEGIMTGLVDRKNLNTAGMVSGTNRPIDPAMLEADTQAILAALNKFAPLPKTRIPFGQVGFALTQGATPIEAAGVGYGAFTKADDARRKLLASRKGTAVTAGLQRQLNKKGAKDFYAAQTPEAQFAAKLKSYSESRIPPIRDNATDIANFEVRHRNKPLFQLNFNYDNKSKKYTPDFRSLPSGGITFNPLDGKAYRKETSGTITPLDPINLKPLSKVDGTES
tara:strand:+ start:57 stop:773 length:717 start_codon:yes stop_codon:yes gene_type:complete